MINEDSTVILNIREYMDYGLDVYGADGTKVGTVDDFDRVAGYLFVRPNPFTAVTHIDPREVFISHSSAEAHREYASPPPRDTFVEKITDPDTGEDDSRAITVEPSGYDGLPIVMKRARIDELRRRIRTGYHVYSSDEVELGKIKSYDSVTGMMTVEKGLFSKHDLLVPVTLVDKILSASHTVYLTFSRADLQRMQRPEPVNVVRVDVEGR